MFFYETQTISVRSYRDDKGFDPSRCDATKCYIGHYYNFLALSHIATYGNMKERAQASAELEICKRKMRYWKRQPHFDHEQALRQKAALHKRDAARFM